ARYLSFEKKTIYLTITMIISCVINIFANYVLIPKMGIIGAAITTMISYVILFLLSWFVLKYIIKTRITSIIKIIYPLSIFLVYLLLDRYIQRIEFTFLKFCIKIILIIFLTATLFKNEIKILIQINK
ncbi:MAG: oligosaccharide flippase family protein, partial [Candidatus Heimdallarchaeota archaeon]|nr:oligosaccharide flippase family protein [Candidatus Heimdallarchaeota archaeon]